MKIRKCTPIIGNGVCYPFLPLKNEIAENWANKYGYPFSGSPDLAHVSQFVTIDKADPMYPRMMLSKMLKEMKTPDFSSEELRNTPYAVLADLNLPIYITTNYDHFMEAALSSKGKNPVSEFCKWNDDLKKYCSLGGVESVFSKGKKYKPTSDTPLVHHLHGDMDIYQSMVLNEKDYNDFIINLSREDDKYTLPSVIRTALVTSNLLFIGYEPTIDSRTIQSVMAYSVGDLREISVLVLLPPKASKDKMVSQTRYLKEYAMGLGLRIYWGSASSFCYQLRTRWE